MPFHSLEGQDPPSRPPHPKQDLSLQKPLFADSSSPRVDYWHLPSPQGQ